MSQTSTGNYLSRQLIEPPAGVTCATPGDCPVMVLYNERGTRNTGYTDIWNNGGKYRYWIQSRARDDTLGPQSSIVVQIPSPTLPAQAAPTNVQFTAEPNHGAAELYTTWDGHQNAVGFLIQFRRSDQSFDASQDGGRSLKNIATNPINMYEADGKVFRPAQDSARRVYNRHANPDPWNTTYYVRVGTCVDRDCTIADVLFAPERSAHMGSNPYE